MSSPDKEQIHKELDLIQDVIKRMADNSFKVKAWMMGIVGAMLAFSKDVIFPSTEANYQIIPALAISLFLLMLVFSFWYLDAFFLQTEKKYRELYKWVVENRKDSDKYLYNLNAFNREIDGTTTNLVKDVESKCRIMVSKTLRWFYIAPALFVLALFIYNTNKTICYYFF